MNSVNLGKIETCVFGKRLILALDSRWLELNDGKLLEFEGKFEKNELIFKASLESGSLKIDQSGGLTDGS